MNKLEPVGCGLAEGATATTAQTQQNEHSSIPIFNTSSLSNSINQNSDGFNSLDAAAAQSTSPNQVSQSLSLLNPPPHKRLKRCSTILLE